MEINLGDSAFVIICSALVFLMTPGLALFYCGMVGVGAEPSAYAPAIPQMLFAAFQMMFAISAPALITGSLVERMKFSALFIFVASWLIFVYYLMAHMVWGNGGLINSLGAVDFAGGNAVHISLGISGLVACIMLGKRLGYGRMSYRPCNIP